MPAKPRVPREIVVAAITDPALRSGEIARRFGYSTKWISQLRNEHGVSGPRGGDRRSQAWREQLQQRRAAE